jgi:hypothetical protein
MSRHMNHPHLATPNSAGTAPPRRARPLIVVPGLASQAAARLARAAALTALTLVLVTVAACSPAGNPAPTVVPTASLAPSPSVTTTPPVAPTPSVDPSAGPSVDPSTPPSEEPSGSPFVPAELGPDRLGRVVATDGLRVRSLPTVGESSQRLEPTLDEGVAFYVADGPVIADGYAWYQIDPYGGAPSLPFGWVAAGSREGEPWVEQHSLGCDAIAPSAESLVSGEPLEQLFCAVSGGSAEVTVVGDVWCTLADDHNSVTGPAWISEEGYCELRTESGSRRVYGQAVHELIDEANNPVEGRYTITGHFDDPGASDCEAFVHEGDPSPDPAEAILWCRAAFVVTEVTPVE